MWRRKDANRPPFERAFYHSASWRRLASTTVAAANGICASCGAEGRVLTGGHVVPIRFDLTLALEPSNVAAQCRSCQRFASVAASRRGPGR